MNTQQRSRQQERKIVEGRALAAARTAGVPIPTGEISGEEPDFRFDSNILGVEISELLKPAGCNFGIVPAEAESYHQQIIRVAQKEYYASADATAVKVILYFANSRGKRYDKRGMARALVEFVKANVPQPDEILTFNHRQLPEGFGSMSLAAESGDWWCGESGSYSLSNIEEALASSICRKKKLLPAYRRNLTQGADIWLLLYSTFAVSRGMEIPHGIDQWRFDFDFERVFWLTTLGNQFVELHRAESPKTTQP